MMWFAFQLSAVKGLYLNYNLIFFFMNMNNINNELWSTTECELQIAKINHVNFDR